MADLPTLLPPQPKVEKPPFELTPLDTLLYSGGTGALLATQLYSGRYPHLAKKVSENVIGAELAAGAPKGSRFHVGPSLLLYALPPPLGIAPPEAYGLDYNYGRTMQLNLRDRVGINTTGLPQSELLHNLPDNDPRVRYHEFQRRAKIEQNFAQETINKLNFQEAADLYTLALSPNAEKLFADPAFVADRAKLRLGATAPSFEEFARVEFDVRTARRFDSLLPAPTFAPTVFPSLLNNDELFAAGGGQVVAGPGEQLLGIKGIMAPAPLDTPPTDARAEGAFNNAPPLVKHLASERNDP